MKNFSVTIPSNYKHPYYPFIIGFRKDFNLDNDLPIIFPIPVLKEEESYEVVFVNQYTHNNVYDRFKFCVEI